VTDDLIGTRPTPVGAEAMTLELLIYEEMRALLEAAVAKGASDLHVRPGSPPKIRVSGSLVPLHGQSLIPSEVEDMVLSTMAPDVAEKFRRTNEADYALSVAGVGRFRVNTFRSRGSVGCVLRVLAHEPTSPADLGLPEIVQRLAVEPRGLVLVTGPTGSGKSTTLAAMVDVINSSRAVHVLTIEDPIEVMHRDKVASITQRELGTDTRDWATALRAAMRQDPDVMLIGEMRDPETVRAALSAAETGHFVLSTLHTTDATETVNRIVDFFPPHEQKQVRLGLAASLRGIICQRLVPRADGEGRICVMEIAVSTPRIAEAIADPDKTDTIADLVAEGGYSGMRTFDQHLLALVGEHTVSADVARAVASNPHDFSVMLRRAAPPPSGADVAVAG
jgi:twitching motility protein PilT